MECGSTNPDGNLAYTYCSDDASSPGLDATIGPTCGFTRVGQDRETLGLQASPHLRKRPSSVRVPQATPHLDASTLRGTLHSQQRIASERSVAGTNGSATKQPGLLHEGGRLPGWLDP
jgi:hypothetical protein